jgi:archaellum component FlaF (FlaF/FlaG flagellin family)
MRSDLGSIVGLIISFVVFFISITILYLILNNTFKGYYSAYTIAREIKNIVGENIEFLNNQTNYSSPYLIIYNNGNKALDLSCFQLYTNGYFTPFNYSINYLYPSNLLLSGENATIYFSNQYLVNNSWNYIILVSCYGVKFQTLIFSN